MKRVEENKKVGNGHSRERDVGKVMLTNMEISKASYSFYTTFGNRPVIDFSSLFF